MSDNNDMHELLREAKSVRTAKEAFALVRKFLHSHGTYMDFGVATTNTIVSILDMFEEVNDWEVKGSVERFKIRRQQNEILLAALRRANGKIVEGAYYAAQEELKHIIQVGEKAMKEEEPPKPDTLRLLDEFIAVKGMPSSIELCQMAESMDLAVGQVKDLFAKASHDWETYKETL